MSPPPGPTSDVRHARRATAVVFAVHGSVGGSFAARLPWIASHLGVGVGQLGVALLMPGFGAMFAMPFSGRLAHNHRIRPLMTATIAGWCLSLVLPSLATSLVLLCAALLVYGATAGLADMAMNAHGVSVERRVGRSVMASFHGFWSLGLLAGSVASALASRAGVDARVQFAVTAVVLAALGAAAAHWFVEDDGAREAHGGAEAHAPPRFALPARPVILIGLVGLCAVFGEQAGTDWSAIFIRHELDGSASVAALAVSAYALTMGLTRLGGDSVIRILGPTRTVRASAACAVSGTAAVILAPDLAVGLGGFALLGGGVALVVPIVFAAAGRVGPHPARSIAGVAGIAYGSGLLTPGVIGGIASASSLKVSFCVVALMVAVMGLAAGVLGGGEATAGPAQAK
jgi:hypothetical protein